MSYTLSHRKIDYPKNIDQDGFIRLTGPERGIDANDDVAIVPIIFHLWFCMFVSHPRHCIWRADMKEDDNLYDKLMFARLKTIFATMEINYAIYNDGAEANLDVSVIDWEGENVEIYGTVGVRNSKITDPKARSLLFENDMENAVIVRAGEVTHLPLLRQVTVLPLEAALIIDVCLLHSGAIFAQGTMRCASRLTGDEELFLDCHPGKIKVKATWLEQKAQDHVIDYTDDRLGKSPAC